ncbi:uncharacterized protein LOC121978161 [Zingiber officinale]|uniref:uncharacterized protein LOC121978161 n=1 Tax=Zingiber officinale TaxID=94328 RepID=UPI001C4B0454|nr:uncharacterized protein LOC121978161 [Zingiber officinale]
MKNEIKLLTQRMENSKKHQKMQDNQIAQIAQSISRAQGTFPGKPDINSVEHCNCIELRSGQTLGDPQIITQKEPDSEEEPSSPIPNQTQTRDGEEVTKKVEGTLQVPPQSQTIPFPQKLITSHKDEERQKGDFETVELTENYSALLMANTPPKLQDPGSFFIPCKIGPELIQRAFCDLGASVSLLPYPMGIVEDVPVKVGGCIVPTDFIIMDMEEDPKIPIILGRPFLATAGAIIDDVQILHELAVRVSWERRCQRNRKSERRVTVSLKESVV